MAKMLKCKKGLSTVVTTLIIVSVSMAAVVLIWGVINNIIKGEIKSSESCFGNYDKIKVNGLYTCYVVEPEANNYTFRFSIMVGDIKLDKIVIAISSASSVKSYQLTNTSSVVAGLTEYPSGSTAVTMPLKNEGKTYQVNEFRDIIDSIQLAPVIGGTQCEISDAVYQIEQCEI